MKSNILRLIFIFAGSLIFVSEASAHPAWAIVVDDKNQIYISDLVKIWKIDTSGEVSVFSERHTHEMTLSKDGNILGEELHYEPSSQKYTAALWRITPNGEFSYILAPTETPPKGISIWKNAGGATYYFGQTEIEPRENFLLKRSAKGDVKVLLGDEQKAMNHRQIVPYSFAGMAFAPDGSLFVKNGTTIWKVTLDDRVSVFVDQLQMSAIVPNTALYGLTVDAENNVYTADFTNKKVLKIAPDKKISIVAQSEKDWSPTGVYYKNKNLYVLENKTVSSGSNPIVRVRKIGFDGKISTVATIGENQSTPLTNSNQQNSSDLVLQSQADEQSGKPCAAVGLMIAASICLIASETRKTNGNKRLKN